jgi:hypothetical protein
VEAAAEDRAAALAIRSEPAAAVLEERGVDPVAALGLPEGSGAADGAPGGDAAVSGAGAAACADAVVGDDARSDRSSSRRRLTATPLASSTMRADANASPINAPRRCCSAKKVRSQTPQPGRRADRNSRRRRR